MQTKLIVAGTMSAATIRTLMSAAQSAIAGSDWATAKNKAAQALALLGAMPDGGKGDLSLEWQQARTALNDLIGIADREIAAAAGATSGNGLFGTSRVNNVAPTSCN